MPRRAKAVGPADGIAEFLDLFIAKFHDPIARRAVQVVMGRVAVIVLESGPIGQPKLAQKA